MLLAPSGPNCPVAGRAKTGTPRTASIRVARAGPPHNRRRSCFRTSYSSLTSSMLHSVQLGSQNLADGMGGGGEGGRRSFRGGYEGVVFHLIVDAHNRTGAGGENQPDWNGTQPSPTQISRLPVSCTRTLEIPRWHGRRSIDGMLGQRDFFFRWEPTDGFPN